jgi:ATP-dependent DNA ligase
VSRRAVESLPRFIEPMRAAPAPAPPIGEGWLLELKWDGCRAQLIVDSGAWTVRSRTGRAIESRARKRRKREIYPNFDRYYVGREDDR